MKKQLIIVSYLLFALTLSSSTFFGKNERVAFLGNSITRGGVFHSNIALFYVTRYPEMPISFFNCGVSGDNTSDIIERLEVDIFAKRPTTIVLMTGMNDMNGFYSTTPKEIKSFLEKRKEALQKYEENVVTIVSLCQKKGIKIILQTPSIYDQTLQTTTTVSWGKNDDLKQCGEIIKRIGSTYNCPVVDYWTPMNDRNQKLQAENPEATIVGKDRIHPQDEGNLFMGIQFLLSDNLPQWVSKMVVSKSINKTKKESLNCKISNIRFTPNDISFQVLEGSLPFFIPKTYQQVEEWTRFNEKRNRQWLQIGNLPKSNYDLYIDDVFIATISSKELNDGVNLARYPETPQMKQAAEVREVVMKQNLIQGKVRTLKFIEKTPYFKPFAEERDMNKLYEQLEPIFKEKKAHTPYYIVALKEYIKNKPLEDQLIKEVEQLQKLMYELAKPKTRTIKLKRL